MKTCFLFRYVCLSVFLLSVATSVAEQDRKVALVWGNSQYNGWDALPACVNDAEVINQKLSSLGFITIMLKDGNRESMSKSLKAFNDMAANADVAVFFYSGHALRIENEYYLVPSNTQLDQKKIYSSDYFPQIDIIRSLTNNSKLSILFFDACRDGINVEGTSKGTYKTEVADDNWNNNSNAKNDAKPHGYKICYATGYGKRALPGDGSLSPFTQVLAEHLTDGDEFITVWNTIEKEVALLTNNVQRPIDEHSYINDFYFNRTGKRNTNPSLMASETKPHDSISQKEITFKTDVPNAIIDFYGTKYEMGKPLLFKEGSSYLYTVEADGYETYTGKLDVTSNTPSSINISLSEIKHAVLKLKSTPSANVYLDGKNVGRTPIDIQTSSGNHSLYLSENGYYEYHSQINVTPGINDVPSISLTKKVPWFWEMDKNNDATHCISYSYSPKYQIGLDYLYRFEESRFSVGLRLACSPGLFRGIGSVVSISQSTSISISTSSSTVNGTTEGTQETTTRIRKGFPEKGYPDAYSKEIDPYNEAKHYDSNFLALANLGFNVCNGILAEFGIGAASNQYKTHMPCYYEFTQKVITDINTGEIISKLEYDEKRIEDSHWYKEKTKWSPAMRLGLRALIPVNSDKFFLTVGGGYTYLLSNNKFSSWDGTIGVAFTM